MYVKISIFTTIPRAAAANGYLGAMFLAEKTRSKQKLSKHDHFNNHIIKTNHYIGKYSLFLNRLSVYR